MSYVPFIGLEKLDSILPNYNDLKKTLVNTFPLFKKNDLPVLLGHSDTVLHCVWTAERSA